MLRLALLSLTLSNAAALSLGTMRPHVRSPVRSVHMNLFGGLMQGITKLQAGAYDQAAVKAKLDNQIKRKPCVMYSLSTCPFCAKAKDQLSSMGTVYTVVELDEQEDGMAMKAELAGITGQTSCPQVFAGGQFLGGCNDGGMGGILPLAKSGKLEDILVKSGALSKTQRI
jgi:glutaredoxin